MKYLSTKAVLAVQQKHKQKIINKLLLLSPHLFLRSRKSQIVFFPILLKKQVCSLAQIYKEHAINPTRASFVLLHLLLPLLVVLSHHLFLYSYLRLFSTVGKGAWPGLRRPEQCPKYTPGGSSIADSAAQSSVHMCPSPCSNNQHSHTIRFAPESWAVFLLLSRWQRPIPAEIIKENSRCWQFLMQSKSHISFPISTKFRGTCVVLSLIVVICEHKQYSNTCSLEIYSKGMFAYLWEKLQVFCFTHFCFNQWLDI